MLCDVAYCVAPVLEEVGSSRRRRSRIPIDFLGVLAFAALGFLVMGYHPGLEDDGALSDGNQGRPESRALPLQREFLPVANRSHCSLTTWMAHFVRWTRLAGGVGRSCWCNGPRLFLILWAVKKIANRLFEEAPARWGGVALVSAMFTLPVTGTALYMVDQHLHPRTLATAMILLAVWRILDEKPWQAAPLLLVAFLLHPLMAALGISFCFFPHHGV